MTSVVSATKHSCEADHCRKGPDRVDIVSVSFLPLHRESIPYQILNTEGNHHMQIHKVVAGSVLAAGLGVAGLFGAGAASADGTAVGSNPSASDTHGFGITNHMQTNNGDNTGIGHIRSAQTKGGPDVEGSVSSQGGTTRVVDADPNTLQYQRDLTGNKFSPGQTSKLEK
jgi:hypothetical protein